MGSHRRWLISQDLLEWARVFANWLIGRTLPSFFGLRTARLSSSLPRIFHWPAQWLVPLLSSSQIRRTQNLCLYRLLILLEWRSKILPALRTIAPSSGEMDARRLETNRKMVFSLSSKISLGRGLRFPAIWDLCCFGGMLAIETPKILPSKVPKFNV